MTMGSWGTASSNAASLFTSNLGEARNLSAFRLLLARSECSTANNQILIPLKVPISKNPSTSTRKRGTLMSTARYRSGTVGDRSG